MICCMLLLLVNPFCLLPNEAGSDAGSSFRFIPRLFISQLSAFSFIFMAPPKLLLVTPMLRLCVALLFPNMFPTVKVFAVAPLVYWIRLSAKLTAATLCRTINLPTIGISTDNCSPFFARPLRYLITRSQVPWYKNFKLNFSEVTANKFIKTALSTKLFTFIAKNAYFSEVSFYLRNYTAYTLELKWS